ncbi:MAG: DEAD/DEAH box helicase, partial [Candidatus Dormibacteraeota bacterium]|nr:DEAD/DEAH box helicase [Candidatus Dormibacteraeota bacterium]
DYAIFECLERGLKAIYTTPLKALSNQKFRDLKQKYGEGYVGLVTGEHTINDQAPVVVMTTEILRNLIYEDPERLREVRYVVLDEVHYIDEFPRGAVWEEVMIQSPPHIHFVGLSATISNYQQVADWMASHRGEMGVVAITQRPTELRLWLAMENKLLPLFDERGQVMRSTWNRAQEEVANDRRFPRHRNLDSNSMTRIIEELVRQQMVPAIYFIFSRRGCEQALQRCAMRHVDLTSAEEKRQIDVLVARKMAEVAEADERKLYQGLLNREMLTHGVAVHHAGLLPFLKELVEELFQAGLIKVVFATETLALGIHMPARAVVISSFTKFDGRGFPALTSGQLTQLMGRAGRRGIDAVGHGVILKDPEVDIGVIYEGAMGEDMVVESKFAPTYNMALNLLRNRDLAEAESLMERSFGQFQRRAAAELRRKELENLRERLEDVEALPFRNAGRERCDQEDVRQYFSDEAELRNLRNRMRRARRAHWKGAVGGAMPDDDFDKIKRRAAEVQKRHEKSPVRGCPNLRAHRQREGELLELRDEIRRTTEEIEGATHEYRDHLHALVQILEEAGFLYDRRPSEKGLLASRVYGENSLLISEAIHDGWFEGLEPAELCAALVSVVADDRGGNRRRQYGSPPQQRRGPTPAAAEVLRQLRTLYFRFQQLEQAYGEDTLRAPSRDYIDFAYRWARGDALDSIPLPDGVDFGDGIKAIRSLYSTLRQMEWAIPEESPVRRTVYQAMRAMERDLIRRV